MQQALSKSIDFLQGREGLFLVLVGALLVQAPHSAEVFHRINTSYWWAPVSWLHSAGFAIVLELAVLLFVVRGRTGLSWSFAGISVLMNIFYYYSAQWWIAPGDVWADIVKCIVTAIALPLAIAFYSHEVADRKVPFVQLAAVHGAQAHGAISATPTIAPVQSEMQEQTEDATPARPDIAERIAQLQGEGLERNSIIDQLLGDGYTGNAIAKALKVDASTVSRRRNAAKQNGHDVAEVSQ